jgi:hypothetical protein
MLTHVSRAPVPRPVSPRMPSRVLGLISGLIAGGNSS